MLILTITVQLVDLILSMRLTQLKFMYHRKFWCRKTWYFTTVLPTNI